MQQYFLIFNTPCMTFSETILQSRFQLLLLAMSFFAAILAMRIHFSKIFFLMPALLLGGQFPIEKKVIDKNQFTHQEIKKNKWKKLFNNKDLSGWETHLNKPHPSTVVPGMQKDSSGNYLQRIGMNNDPLKVFTVTQVDGTPVIQISGQVFGCIATEESFSDFHLRLQFKWGQKKWPPRDNDMRDSGVLYFSLGKPGEGSDNWMVSQECQVQERDCGDFWKVGPTVIDIPARAGGDKGRFMYDSNSSLVPFGENTPHGPSCAKFPDNENPSGEWNTIEVYGYKGNSIHIVNGVVVMRLFNSRIIKNGIAESLAAGKIQLQSEGAEVFYRNIEIMPLTKMPSIMKEYKLTK